ncbi:MAG: acyl-ACP--UDP-N-acetylglucosamine O-acyltransferase [Bauldia sp.]
MSAIHSTAIVEAGARLGADVSIGAYSMIGPDVVLGDNVTLGPHVFITGRTTIGAGTRISPYAVIGGEPQDIGYRGEPSTVSVGTNCVIREHVTIHRGTARGRMQTVIGPDCFLMVGVHVAHDCVVGHHVILVNQATLGGHVQVGDYAILSGLVAVQQRQRVGAHAFVGGLTGVMRDVIPFGIALGERAELGGLNLVGLKRRGFDRPTIHALRAAYRMVFFGDDSFDERVERTAEQFADIPPVMEMIEFIRTAGKNGLCLPRDLEL